MEGKHRRSTGTHKSKKVLLALIISAVVLLIIYFAIDSSIQRNYYMKELKVCSAVVIEKSNDGGSSYIKVRLTNSVPGVYLSDDDSWVLENGSCSLGQDVGLLVANYDIFEKKYWGLFGDKGQKFEKDKWVIEKLYNSYEQAQSDNPAKSIKTKAILKKKKTTGNGSMFFVLESEGRTFQAKVDQSVYEKYSVNQEIQCEFEGIGEFLKFSRIAAEN